MVSIGLRLPASKILATPHRRFAVVATLGLALLFVPVVAWAIVRLIGVSDPVATGILLVAAAPGGSLALKLVDLAEGDVALGLWLFFALAALAPFSMPPTIAVLTGSGSIVNIDAVALFTTLIALQFVPLAAAVMLARVAPDGAARFGSVATHLATVLLVALILVSVFVNADEIAAIGLNGLLGFVLVTVSALVAALILGRKKPRAARAMAFVVSQRSTSLALLVAISLNVPEVTGAVIAGGLVMLMVNPVAAALQPLAWPMRVSPVVSKPADSRG
jgi:BASS family bile acid:Na+ symporter